MKPPRVVTLVRPSSTPSMGMLQIAAVRTRECVGGRAPWYTEGGPPLGESPERLNAKDRAIGRLKS